MQLEEILARTLCAATNQQPDRIVSPGIVKPTGPDRPWWTFRLKEVEAVLTKLKELNRFKDDKI